MEFYLILLVAQCISLACSSFPVQLSQASFNTCTDGNVELAKIRAKAIIKDVVNPRLLEQYGPPSGPPCSCGESGSWTRAAFLNMSDPTQQCPSNWTLSNQVRGCGRRTQGRFTCDSVFYSVGQSYSKICGRINAYQVGATDAFDSFLSFGQTSIDTAYIDGISVTHGAPGSRQHIWSFVVALYEQDSHYVLSWNCPCTNRNLNWPFQTPLFVNNDYFCNTGNTGPGYNTAGRIYPGNDVLWDGEGCGATNDCCQFNNPPWFCTSLQQPTTDDLELRLCMGEVNEEDALVTFVDIYVQ